MSLKKLMDLVSKLRIVKHGDTIMADDHNSLVNVSKAIQEVLLPSGVTPDVLDWDIHFFDNFISPCVGSHNAVFADLEINYFTNIYSTSIAKPCIFPAPGYTYRWIQAWSIEYTYPSSTEFPITVNSIATVSKPVPPGEIDFDKYIITYDVMGFNINANNETVEGLIYLIYSKEGGYISIIDNSNIVYHPDTDWQNIGLPVFTTYVKVSDDVFFDWVITELYLTFDNRWCVSILDKNGNELISYTFSSVEMQTSPWLYFNSGGYFLPMYIGVPTGLGSQIQVMPMENMYDWVSVEYRMPL